MNAPRISLRVKITLAALVIEALMLAFLIGNSLRLSSAALDDQAEHHLAELAAALGAALQAPLAQQDDAAVREIVETLHGQGRLVRVAVFDRQGRLLHAAGAPAQPGDQVKRFAVTLGTVRYGDAQIVLSRQPLIAARQTLVRESLTIAGLALLLTGVLLWFAMTGLTRRFSALARASQRMAAGELGVRLADSGTDEIGQLVAHFNRMAEAVSESVTQARESEARFHAIADYTHDLEFWLSPEGRLLWVNPSVERMLGCGIQHCMDMPDFPLPLIHPDDREAATARMHEALTGTSGSGYTLRMQRVDGRTFWAVVNWQPIHDHAGTYRGIRASLHDIDALKATEASLRQALADLGSAQRLQQQALRDIEAERARLVALLSAMNLGILFVGADGRVLYHNPVFQRMWGLDETAPLVGLDVRALFARATSLPVLPDEFRRHLDAVLGYHALSGSFEIALTDGRLITELDYPVRDAEGQFLGHLWVYEDITRERQTAQQLLYLAERDALTGLYNRHRFHQELNRVLAEATRQSTRAAVMFFDLDEFKAINDTYGHRAGDALLVRVAGEIGALVRRNELFARLGGDEFAILLPRVDGHAAEVLAERIVHAVAQIPFRFDGQNLRLTTSLGIAYCPDHATDADELVAHADIAMYQAKQAGRNTWRVWRPDSGIDSEIRLRLSWAERISHALEHQLFELHFQGVYRVSDGTLSHLEALIRMQDDTQPGTLIPPGVFIPLAEKSGRILDIDRWVCEAVIDTLARCPGLPPVALNLSGRSLSEPGLPACIQNHLARTGVDPARLIIEITETAAVSDLADAQRMIEALHALGCRVYLDDFGVGFASFAYLKHLDVDTIKIDGMFIRDLAHDTDNQVFVQAMASVARGLGKTVLAEYVENAETLTLLAQYGIDLAQGYHLDKPTRDHPAFAGACISP